MRTDRQTRSSPYSALAYWGCRGRVKRLTLVGVVEAIVDGVVDKMARDTALVGAPVRRRDVIAVCRRR